MSTAMDRLNHIGIVVQDIESSIRWYVEHLGFERMYSFGFPGVHATFVKRGAFRLEFFQVEGAEPMSPEREQPLANLRIGGINHFAIEVDDIDAAVAELESKGVTIVSPPQEVPGSGGERYAFIHDNERMLVELFQPLPA